MNFYYIDYILRLETFIRKMEYTHESEGYESCEEDWVYTPAKATFFKQSHIITGLRIVLKKELPTIDPSVVALELEKSLLTCKSSRDYERLIKWIPDLENTITSKFRRPIEKIPTKDINALVKELCEPSIVKL